MNSDGRRAGDRGFATVDDERLRVLSKQRRRRVLSLLADDGRYRLAAVANSLATDAQGAPPDRDRVQQVYLELYHTDVPALAAVDLVAYDADIGTLELTEHGDRFLRLLDDTIN